MMLIATSAVACAVANEPYAFGLRAREALLVAALALLLAILFSRKGWRHRPAHTSGALAVLAIVAFTGPIVDPAFRNVVTLATCVATLCASAAALISLHDVRESDAVGSSGARLALPRRAGVLAAAAVVSLALAASIVMSAVARGGRPLIVDEVLYLFQAVTLGEPGFGRTVDSALESFFVLPQSFVRDGVLRGQYPLGWPLLLALGRAMAIQPALNALFIAGVVALTFLVGRCIMPPKLAVLAATLVALNATLVEAGADYFAHASTTALVLLATLLLLRAADGDGSSRARMWTLAGLALGLAVSIRPLTGVSLGASVWLWMLLRSHERRLDVLRMTAWMTMGAIPLIAATLAYNHVTTGAATRFGYAAANGDLVDMGFGVRGIIGYDRTGSPVPLTNEFTPIGAARNVLRVAGDFTRAILPSAAIVAVLAVVGRSLRERRTAAIAAGFLVLPVLQSLYYYPSVRFYTELLPFVVLGACALLGRWTPHRALVRAVVLFAVLASILSLAGRFAARHNARDDVLLANRLVERTSAEQGPILVFVADDVPGEGMLGRLWWYNVDSFRGPIVVARDLGARNAELIRAYPAHLPFRLRRTGGTDAVMNPLDRTEPGPGGRVEADSPPDDPPGRADVASGDGVVHRKPER